MTSPPRSVARRMAHAVLLTAATLLGLAAIHWLRTHQAGHEDKFFPIVHAGRQKQRIQARNFTVQVHAWRLADTIRVMPEADPDGLPIRLKGDSNGTWLAMSLAVEALQTPGVVTAQLVTADGRVYPAAGPDRPRLDGTNLSGFTLSPGLARNGVFFFWIPGDSLQGLHAQFYWGPADVASWDSLVDIDMGIDAAGEQAMRKEALPLMDMFE